MERRQFLIGAGSILTASFVSKVEMFLNNKNVVLPIIKKSEAKQTIYFIDNSFDFELRLNSIHFDFYTDTWGRRDSPHAKAYQLLDGMDLYDYSTGKGRLIGGLKFIDGFHPGNDYLAVRADNAMSANLLQARLLELGEHISVEIVGGAS